jgi:hypothetical protein
MGVGGGCVIWESDGANRRVVAKGPKLPRWLTVKGMRAIWCVFRDWRTASVDEAVVVLPWNLE